MLRYLLFASVFLAYFIVDLVLSGQNLQQLLRSNHEFLLMSQRSSYSNIIRYYTE